MAKLYFRYGAMGSLKSANILMVRETCTVQYTIFQRKNRAGRRTDHAGFQLKLCGTLQKTL